MKYFRIFPVAPTGEVEVVRFHYEVGRKLTSGGGGRFTL